VAPSTLSLLQKKINHHLKSVCLTFPSLANAFLH